MVKGGYSSLMEPLAATLNIQRGVAVSQISYNNHGVKVTSSSGELTCFIMTVKQGLCGNRKLLSVSVKHKSKMT